MAAIQLRLMPPMATEPAAQSSTDGQAFATKDPEP